MILLIVESPTKARTIKKFLPKEYMVTSSFGHMRDLPKSKMGVDIENNFEPQYIIPKDKQKKVTELRKTALKAEKVILASDEDREGEAIAWHLQYIINDPKKKTPTKKLPQFERIVFHEITKKAILKALENPRSIDTHLVDAQQARRVLDRLVGYELSPFLWKKIRRGLSAGRVQSVALRFIVEREKERENFKKHIYFTLETLLSQKNTPQLPFEAQLIEIDDKRIEKKEKVSTFAGSYTVTSSSITSKEDAKTLQTDLKDSTVSVKSIEKKQTKRTPPPPFTTSTLQQTAINRLGFSSKQTMRVAQKLYEQGLITYMRTDSVNLSLDSLMSAKKVLEQKYGKKYALDSPRYYKNRSKGAQEAHEAIRPTQPSKTPDELSPSLDSREVKLYRLIWERMLASQSSQALIDSTKILFKAQGKKASYTLLTHGSTIAFDGFLAVSGNSSLSDTPPLPEIQENEMVDVREVKASEKETAPPPRYTEASLVKVLEDREIGRPSTYAPTISTLFDRGYVERDENKKLFPQEIGTLVSDLLSKHFQTIVDIDFTASLEKSLDEIAEGNKAWKPLVKDVYIPFHENLEKKSEEVKQEDISEKIGRNCPECGNDLILKHGRFGKFIACSEYPKCKYTEKSEEDKTLEKEYAKDCSKCGSPMTVKRGRFGPFLGCSNYPECKNIEKIENSTGVKCPKCEKGEIVERKSKRGKVFYGCNEFPKCKTAYWSKPTGEKCPKCESLLVFGPKNTKQCSEKECLYNKKRKK
jgi:DNA topoisomerase-1